jgi:3D (Asp-Asp-Asp) domain-containing protein
MKFQRKGFELATALLKPFSVLSLLVVAAFATAGPMMPEGVHLSDRIVDETIEYPVKYEFDRNLGRGRVKKVQNGFDGELYQRFTVLHINGKPVLKSLLEERKKEVIPAVFLMGPQGFQGSRGAGSFERAKVMTMESTAYTPSAGRGSRATFRTATGRRAAYGVVAVDPRVIPLGTLVFVEGYGFAIAADTGGAIKGNKIDVCIESYREAIQWGRRDVKVHIFKSPKPTNPGK